MKQRVISAILILIVTFVLSISPWLFICVRTLFSPNPPAPKIKHAEFPFTLVYQINGETKTIKDTFICDFAGYSMNEGDGKYREWKSKLASGKQRIVLLTTYGKPAFFADKATKKQEIYFELAIIDAKYLMGDSVEYGNPYVYGIACFEQYQDNTSSDDLIVNNTLLSRYNIKIICFNIAPPIKNQFGNAQSTVSYASANS